MALIDTIRANLATAGSTPVGNTDQTGLARQLFAAKSGKQVTPSTLAPQSAIGEAAAVDQTNAALIPVQQQGQLASAAIGQQQQQQQAQEQSARSDLALRQQSQQQQNSIRKQQLLSDLGRDRSTLSLEKNKAQLEQLAHTMRLSDKQYLDRLAEEGVRQRLDNDLQFKEALQKSILGSNTDLLKKSLSNHDILAADDREFRQAMSNISLDYAIQMAHNEEKDAKAAAVIQGAGTLASTAAQAYAGSKSTPATTTTPAANAGTTQAHGGPGSSDVAGSSWRSGY